MQHFDEREIIIGENAMQSCVSTAVGLNGRVFQPLINPRTRQCVNLQVGDVIPIGTYSRYGSVAAFGLPQRARKNCFYDDLRKISAAATRFTEQVAVVLSVKTHL
jgi:hypothetical protein